jgi:hypothetical protein
VRSSRAHASNADEVVGRIPMARLGAVRLGGGDHTGALSRVDSCRMARLRMVGFSMLAVVATLSCGSSVAAAQSSSERLHSWAAAARPAIGACPRSERMRAWFRSEAQQTVRAQPAPPARVAWSDCARGALAAARPSDLPTTHVWVVCNPLGCDVFAFEQDELDPHGVAWAVEDQLVANDALALCAAGDPHVENLVVILESAYDEPRARYVGDVRGPLASERAVGACYARALGAFRYVRPPHYAGEAPALRVELTPAILGLPYHSPLVRVAQAADLARE